MRSRRYDLRMTQAHLARHAGVDQRQIRRYEAGVSQPPLNVAARIATALGVTLDQLAGRTTPPTEVTSPGPPHPPP